MKSNEAVIKSLKNMHNIALKEYDTALRHVEMACLRGEFKTWVEYLPEESIMLLRKDGYKIKNGVFPFKIYGYRISWKQAENKNLQRFERFIARHSKYCSREETLKNWEKWAKYRIWTVGDLIDVLSGLDKNKYINICDRYYKISDVYQIKDEEENVRLQIEEGLMMGQDV